MTREQVKAIVESFYGRELSQDELDRVIVRAWQTGQPFCLARKLKAYLDNFH